MKEFNEKKKLKKILYSKVSIFFLIVIFFFLAKASYSVYQKQVESHKKATKAELELAELKARQETLSAEIKRLNTEAGVEEEIRDKFKMAKDEERMVVIVDEEGVKAPEEKPVGFFSNLLFKFKSFFGNE